MAAILNTLTARIVFIGLLIHAVLLPLLFYGMLYIVEQSHEEQFVNDVRKYSRFLADVFELHDVMDEKHSVQLLDSAVLGSGGVYAELIEGETRLQSGSLPADQVVIYKEDFSFGQHSDNIYFLSIQLGHLPGRQVVLRMGFDELPTVEQIKLARQRLIIVLFSYLMVSIIVLVLLSTRMTRPLKILQQASRNIAKGQYTEQLKVDSQLSEIRELAIDLESMRCELVGINISLKQEIIEREVADKRRGELESELRQTQKLETVGVLAGGIAHEFNNILLPIFLYTEQALHDLPPGKSSVRGCLERVLKSSKRAKSLVQQILTFSHQHVEQEYKQVDIKLIVEEALELLRALIPSTVELHQDLTDGTCLVWADRNQIHQLVMNLCSNAYQALDDSGGSITLTLDRFTANKQFPRDRCYLRAGKYIRLSVQDTGHGIDSSHLDRIFEPFYTTSSIGKGTGLGLSVAHGIVMSHKGGISVESKPGKGTTFYVYLPEIEQDGEITLSHDQKLPASQ